VKVIAASTSGVNDPAMSNPGVQQFRVVVFKGSRMAGPHVNWNNYIEVKQAFNLAD
jgi:hypothetical protein